MESISIKDYFLYLFGNEKAIKKLAFSKNSLYFGAFFVLIAGIAREYDQENLGTFVFSGGKVISYRPRSIDISA